MKHYTRNAFNKRVTNYTVTRVPSFGMLRRETLVRIDVSEELSASAIRVTRIGELGMLAVTSNRRRLRRNTMYLFLRSVRRLLVTVNTVLSSPIHVTLMIKALRSFETSVLTRATRRNMTEDGILHNHRRENLKSYTVTKTFCGQLP
jgi:hypothetical protein